MYNEFYAGGLGGQKEKYIAPMYGLMIDKGLDVTISIVDAAKVHVLGTPEELQEFIDPKA